MLVYALALIIQLAFSEYVEFEIHSKMRWGWEFITEDTIRFTVKCKVDGWCAIGLGNSKMFPTDMFAVYLNDKLPEVGDFWASSYGAPTPDTSRNGGSQDYTLVASSHTVDVMTAVFDRKLDTGDKWDWEIVKGEEIEFIWAFHGSDGSFREFHNKFGSGNVKLDDKDSSYLEAEEEDLQNEFEHHGWLQTILWFVVTHVAIIVARYCKAYYWWYWVHMLLFSATVILTILSVFQIYNDKEAQNVNMPNTEKTYTSRVGFAITHLILSQCAMGFMTRFFIWKTKENIHIIATLRNAHKILGWILVVLTHGQIYFGWDRFDETYDENMTEYVYIFYIVIGLVYTLLELNYQLGSRLIFHPFAEFRRWVECGSPKLPEMSYEEARQLISQGRKLAFYDDIVMDISGYSWSHPGGSIMIEKSVGQDLGKYLHGCSSINSNFNAYNHSYRAFNIARQLAVGLLPRSVQQDLGKKDAKIKETAGANPQSDVATLGVPEAREDLDAISLIENPSQVIDNPNQQFMMTDSNWRFIERTEIATDTFDFCFASESACMKNYIDESAVAAMGQHFSVSYGGVTRYYSFSLALKPDHVAVLDYYLKNGIIQEVEAKSDYVHLYIKAYSSGRLTQELVSMPMSTVVRVKGPMGPGLHLTPKTTGRCVAFGGGTGVIPFLDLVEFLYWKKVSPETSPKMLEGLKLTLYAAFTGYDHVVGETLINATAELYEDDDTFILHTSLDKEPTKRSTMQRRSSFERSKRIDQTMVNTIIDKNVTWAWICGPSGFIGSIRDMLANTELPEDRIVAM